MVVRVEKTSDRIDFFNSVINLKYILNVMEPYLIYSCLSITAKYLLYQSVLSDQSDSGIELPVSAVSVFIVNKPESLVRRRFDKNRDTFGLMNTNRSKLETKKERAQTFNIFEIKYLNFFLLHDPFKM